MNDQVLLSFVGIFMLHETPLGKYKRQTIIFFIYSNTYEETSPKLSQVDIFSYKALYI